MKKSTVITALVAILAMAVTPTFAQKENGFQWFHDAELLCAGDKEKNNAMTIGWGGIGTLWGRTALTVYVAEKRYTKEFMDKAEYFTVMAFDVEQSKVLNYMGTKSGRDGDCTQEDVCQLPCWHPLHVYRRSYKRLEKMTNEARAEPSHV